MVQNLKQKSMHGAELKQNSAHGAELILDCVDGAKLKQRRQEARQHKMNFDKR